MNQSSMSEAVRILKSTGSSSLFARVAVRVERSRNLGRKEKSAAEIRVNRDEEPVAGGSVESH